MCLLKVQICNHCIRLNYVVMNKYLTLSEASELIGKS
jgi:hypothetical protein